MYLLKGSEYELFYYQVLYPSDECSDPNYGMFFYQDLIRKSASSRVGDIGNNLMVYQFKSEKPDFLNGFTKMDTDGKRPLDFYTSPIGVHLVSDHLKNIIEDLDPNVHSFWPANVIVNGKVVGGYNYMMVGRVVVFDGLDRRCSLGELERYLKKENKEIDFGGILNEFPLFSFSLCCESIFSNEDVFSCLKNDVIVGLWDKNNLQNSEDEIGIVKI